MIMIVCPGCNGPYLEHHHRWWTCRSCGWERRDPQQKWAARLAAGLQDGSMFVYDEDVGPVRVSVC